MKQGIFYAPNAIIIPEATLGNSIDDHFSTYKTIVKDDINYHALPWNYKTVAKLRSLGVEAASPRLSPNSTFIASDIIVNGVNMPPMPEQLAAMDTLSFNRRAFDISDMGTGKTASSVLASAYLLHEKVVRKVLIVTVMNALVSWKRAIQTMYPQYTVGIIAGSISKKAKVINESYDYSIINHDGVSACREALQEMQNGDGRYDLVIADEATKFKHPETRRTKDFYKLFSEDKATRIWALTGTPAPNSPMDGWGIAHFVLGGHVVPPKGMFEAEVMYVERTINISNGYGGKKSIPVLKAKHNSATKIAQLLQPAVRNEKANMDGIPPVLFEDRDCSLSLEQDRLLSQLVKECCALSDSGKIIDAPNKMALHSKLLQVFQGVALSYDEDGDRSHVTVDCSPRLSALDDIVGAAGKKVLVLATFTSVVDMLEEHFIKSKVGVVKVYGDMSQKARDAAVDAFKHSDDIKVMVANPTVVAHNLTLTEADVTVWWGPHRNPEDYEQANNRMNRPGQISEKVTIFELASSEQERRMYRTLRCKGDLQQEALNIIKDLGGK